MDAKAIVARRRMAPGERPWTGRGLRTRPCRDADRISDGIPVLRIQKQGTASTVYYAGIPGGSAAKRRTTDLATGIVVREGALSLRSGASMRSVRLVDATGRMVFEANGSGTSIALEGLGRGVYLAKVVRADGSALEETVAIP